MLDQIRQFFRQLFIENLLLKAISLIIAFMLWGFLMIEKKSEMALTIPIRVENIPAGLVMTEPPPTDVRVVVRGTRTQLSTLDSQVPYVIDLTASKAGLSVFDVVPEKIILPRGLQIVHMSPAQFTIRLSTAVRRNLPVALRFRGELPPGYSLKKVTVNPEVITIDAAKEEISGLKSIESEPIDLSPLRGDVQLNTDLATGHLHIIDITTHSVEVLLDIEELQGERVIARVPVQIPSGWRATGRNTVDVNVRGPVALLSNLTPASFSAFVQPRQKTGRVRAPVRVEAPERVSITRISPAYLEVSP